MILSRKKLVFFIGPTCSGKTSAIDALCEQVSKFTSVKIGQEMRKRHPPEYFNGLAAMKHTEVEVQEIYFDALADFRDSQHTALLVDGVPRLPEQVGWAFHPDFDIEIFNFVCPPDVLRSRALASREGSSLDLALQRITNDFIQGKVVLDELDRLGYNVTTVFSDSPSELYLKSIYAEITGSLEGS